MIKIYDGRNEFYQWDLNRKLIIDDATVTEVHFCNKTSDCSLVVAVQDGGIVDVPNILLQTDWTINVYLYCGDCYTKEHTTFKVNKRSKPDDYVYTETEVKRWDALAKEIDEKLEQIDTVINQVDTHNVSIANNSEAINNHETRLTNIERHISNDYFLTDEAIEYNKVVDTSACPYAEIGKIGGMTHKIEPELYPLFHEDYGAAGFDTSADGTVTASNTTGSPQSFSDSLSYDGYAEYYFTLSSECPYITYAAIVLQYVKIDETTGSYDVNEVAYPLNSWIPKINYEEYVAVDADFCFTVAANAGTVTFKPVLAETEDIEPKLLDTKVTELVSEGANLIPFPYNIASNTVNGTTYTIGDDGSVAINVTPTSGFSLTLANWENGKVFNGSYTMSIGNTLPAGSYFGLLDAQGNRVVLVSGGQSQRTSTINGIYTRFVMWISVDGTYNNHKFYPMLNYGEEAAPYKLYRAEAVDTFPISAELRAFLEPYGYGRGVSGYPNYIDFERKVFMPMVKEVDMGLLNWGYRLNNNRHIFNANLSAYGIQGQISPDIPINALAEDYRAVTVNATWVDRDMAYNSNTLGNQVIEIVDNRYTNQTDFKAAVSGKKLLFALATPIEIDVSEYLTNDNYIEVEAGGTIRAINEYNQAAPTSITYLLKEGSI